MKHESAEDMHQVIPHVNDEHVNITSSDLHLDSSAEETHSTLSPGHNTICNYSAEEPSHMMHTISDDNSPEDYELSHTLVHLFAENGEKFNAYTIKIIEDTDKETNNSIIVIDDPDQVTMKGPVDIDYPDEDLTKTNVNIEHPDLVIVTFDDHLPDQSNSKKHNKENTIMTNPTLLSPLQGSCYNMAQQQLHHVASLTNQRETYHGSLKTSSISSDAHLEKPSSAPSYDVTAHCNQDSLPDFPTYHTKVQTSLRSEYFDAFSQLMHLIAQKKPVYKKMTCLHGETKHDRHSICMEMLHEKYAPNTAFENSTSNHLMHHSPSLHPPDLCAPFRIFAISKLWFVPCKVTLDNHLGNYVHFHHTQEFSPTNLADDDPTSIHPKSIFFHSPADDDPTQSLLSTWPLIPYLLDASITFYPALWDTSTSTPTTIGTHLLPCCADPSVGEIQLTSFLMDCKSDGTEESPPKILQVLVNLFIWHHYEDMFKVLLFVAHQDHQVLLEWETGESTFETTTANASMSSLLIPLKILVSTMSSSGATQSCQNLYNFHKNMKWETLTLETLKDAQCFKASWHAWKTDVYVNKTNKEHDQAQWELGQVLNASPVGHHLNGIGNMQLSGLIHFHKSDDPYAIELFDEGSTVLPKLLVDMTTTSHPFLLLQEQVPGLCCVKVLDTKDSSKRDFQSQSDYDHSTSYEIVDPIFDTCNTNQGYFDAKNTAIGSGVVLNDSKRQAIDPAKRMETPINKMILARTMERLVGQLESFNWFVQSIEPSGAFSLLPSYQSSTT
ncbi:hypothetical protein ACA910_013926 [Epithemia clementina (nom. ined.)]